MSWLSRYRRSRHQSSRARKFMLLTTIGFLLSGGTLALHACGDGNGTDPDPILRFGFVHVTINGLAGGFTSAGSVHIEGLGFDTTVVLPGVADTTARVLVGSYEVTYATPPGYALASGSNVFDVTILENDTTDLVVNVVQTTSTLEVVVDGLEAGVADGGSASVLRTDLPGQIPVVLLIPNTGSGTLPVLPGNYSVTYTAPDTYQLVAGETNPKSTSVGIDDSVSVPFEVEPEPPPPADVIFHSDFSTALGKTDAALRDTNKEFPWSAIVGNGTLNEVVPSTGLDFPSANVLYIGGGWRGEASPGAAAQNMRMVENSIPLPAIGESIYYRWYIRVLVPDDYMVDPLTHPIQDGQAGSQTNWMFEVLNTPDGVWELTFNLNNNAHPNNRWSPAVTAGNTDPIGFAKDSTYRIELQIHRVGNTTFQMHARVYDHNDVLLYDDDDFKNVQGTQSLANSPTFNFNILQNLTRFQGGLNGLNGGVESDYPVDLYYQGAFCIRADDWCGPYSGGV